MITRSLRKMIARLLIGVLFVAQMALAAHACNVGLVEGRASTEPGTFVAAPIATDAHAAAVPICHHVDPGVPDLCVQHCAGGHASSDPARPLLTLAPLAALAPLYAWPALTAATTAVSIHPVALADAGRDVHSRPHAVMHCVLRL